MDRGAIVVLCGVAGSGKTTIGRRLASVLGVAFVDGDDCHSPAARATMRSGRPIDGSERSAWLDRVAEAADAARPTVVACSALGRRHRDSLRRLGEVTMVLLDVSPDELARRLTERPGHFAGPGLLASQLASYEPPTADERVRRVDAGQGVDACVEDIARMLRDR